MTPRKNGAAARRSDDELENRLEEVLGYKPKPEGERLKKRRRGARARPFI